MYSRKRRFRSRATGAAPAPAPAPPPFSPASLTNLSLWLDAADSSTISFSSGSNVSRWDDKSGNTRNLTPLSGTTTYTANSIRLNTSAMSVSNAVNLSELSFFIVAFSPNNVSNQTLFVGRPQSTAGYSTVDGFSFYVDANTNNARYYGNYLVGSQSISNSLVSTSRFLATLTATSNGSLATWQNGTAGGTAATNARTNTAQGFAIGTEWSGSNYVNFISSAHYYEVIVYNTALSTTQRQQVEGYLAWKWGLQTSLPTNHPHYSSSP